MQMVTKRTYYACEEIYIVLQTKDLLDDLLGGIHYFDLLSKHFYVVLLSSIATNDRP